LPCNWGLLSACFRYGSEPSYFACRNGENRIFLSTPSRSLADALPLYACATMPAASPPAAVRPRLPRVALLIESSRAYGRGLLLGIARFVRERGPWSIYSEERALQGGLPAWLRGWEGDGIIARIEDARMARALARLGLPCVDLRGLLPDLPMPCLDTDPRQVAHLAFQHLRERGFRQLAFCGFPGASYSDERGACFREFAASAGLPCAVYSPPAAARRATTAEYERDGLAGEEDVARWLADLPQPVGVMACNDVRGQQVLNACRERGLAVPEQVAVVGVDNDEVLCELADPPLTSVEPDTRRIGFEAAALLARLMRGSSLAPGKVWLAPRGIVTRRSTDFLAVDDPGVVAAAQFIRAHACEGIRVADVVQGVPFSRRNLELRFARWLGRSLKEEILHVRIQRAKSLLAETDLKLSAIAEESGFRHAEYLVVMFKARVGVTPAAWRERNRPRNLPRLGATPRE
jgi:LacI family transcriptional regulator